MAGAACLGRKMRRPETLRLRARPERRHELLGGVVLAIQRLLGRIDVLLEERAVRRTQLFELLERRELRSRHGPIIAP